MVELRNSRISVLIISRDRRNDLERLVADLLEMKTSYAFDIIVVEETDHPEPIDGVTYVAHPVANLGIPYARNLALAHASCDILVFLDDDCILHEDWLDTLLAPFIDESVIGVQGGVSVPDSTNAIGWAETLLGFPGGGIKRILQTKEDKENTIEMSTLNCAYRKSVVDKVGGFVESLKVGGEDYVLAKQVCQYGTCLFVPRAMVSHQARGKLSKIWHWFTRRGHAEVDVIRSGTQKETTMWTLARRSLTIKLMFLFLLCALFPQWSVYLFLGAFLLYFFFQYTRCYKTWMESKAPVGALILLPIVKLTMDVAVDWGRLRGLALD